MIYFNGNISNIKYGTGMCVDKKYNIITEKIKLWRQFSQTTGPGP